MDYNHDPDIDYWKGALFSAVLELGAEPDIDGRHAAYARIVSVLDNKPEGLTGAEPDMDLTLLQCLGYICKTSPLTEEEKSSRLAVATQLLHMVKPWRGPDDPGNQGRVFHVLGTVISSNDPDMLEMAFNLPGSLGMDYALRPGFFMIDPMINGIGFHNMKPAQLPANTGPMKASIRWMGLMGATCTRYLEQDTPLTLCEQVLARPEHINEPVIGDRSVFEFALRPKVIQALVEKGANPFSKTSGGELCLARAVRSHEACLQTLAGLSKLLEPGQVLSGMGATDRADLAVAFIEKSFHPQGVGTEWSWVDAVRRICPNPASATTSQGKRLVDELGRVIVSKRWFLEHYLQILSQLGVSPAQAGEGTIGNAPAWAGWEWIHHQCIQHHVYNDGTPLPQGLFRPGVEWDWGDMSCLVINDAPLLDVEDQALLINAMIEHAPTKAMECACAFLGRLDYKENIDLSSEFEVGLMMKGFAEAMKKADADDRTVGTLVPWMALFDKPIPIGLEMDHRAILDSCDRIERIIQAATSQDSFLGGYCPTLAQVRALASSSRMLIDTAAPQASPTRGGPRL